MPTTRAIRAVGFVHLPGSTEVLHYPIVVSLVNAKQVRNVFRRALAHSPDELAVISRLIQEWSRICEELEARDHAAEESHSQSHGASAAGES